MNILIRTLICWPRKHSGSSFTLIAVALACSVLAAVAQATPGEDRGNGNSAA